jgi:hypothetical protein
MDRVITEEQKIKLKQIVSEGTAIMQEVEDLNEGLNDTIKAVAAEMEIKPAILKKAIKTAQKGNFQDQFDDFDTLETILDVVGRKQ